MHPNTRRALPIPVLIAHLVLTCSGGTELVIEFLPLCVQNFLSRPELHCLELHQGLIVSCE